MLCADCHGSGQKRGTTLTCYTCRGIGVVPDAREELKDVRQQVSSALEELGKERARVKTVRPTKARGKRKRASV